jgi:hypothetical protein
MIRMATALLVSLFFATSTFAQSTCETQAVSKDGKPLAGAAKSAFVKKCKKDACGPKAARANGAPSQARHFGGLLVVLGNAAVV